VRGTELWRRGDDWRSTIAAPPHGFLNLTQEFRGGGCWAKVLCQTTPPPAPDDTNHLVSPPGSSEGQGHLNSPPPPQGRGIDPVHRLGTSGLFPDSKTLSIFLPAVWRGGVHAEGPALGPSPPSTHAAAATAPRARPAVGNGTLLLVSCSPSTTLPKREDPAADAGGKITVSQEGGIPRGGGARAASPPPTGHQHTPSPGGRAAVAGMAPPTVGFLRVGVGV